MEGVSIGRLENSRYWIDNDLDAEFNNMADTH